MNIVRKYFRSTDDCIVVENGKIMLGKKLDLTKQIGSPSVYGVTYLSQGTGMGRLLKLAVKIIERKQSSYDEIMMLHKLSVVVEKQQFINFPLLYHAKECKSPNPNEKIQILKNPYYLVMNELASGDLKQWLHEKVHKVKEYFNALIQIMLTLAKFQKFTGKIHNDCHWGNFLYHNVPIGGYWWYNMNGIDIYIENVGKLWVLWDFGLIKDVNKKHFNVRKLDPTDIYRILYAFDNKGWMQDVTYPKEVNMFVSNLKKAILNENAFNVTEMLFMFSNTSDKSWIFQKPENVLNNKPFVI